MNEREKVWVEKQRQSAAALAEIGIRPAEAALFNVVHHGLTVPPWDLCRRAAYSDYSVGGAASEPEVEAALAGCLSKGWLQIVDGPMLAGVRDEVRRKEFLGPVYGYPTLGGVDFTRAGAEQWFQICDRLWGGRGGESFGYCDVVHEKSAHYFCSQITAVAQSNWQKVDEDVASVTGPFPIGPWRANWWRRFPDGYRVEVEQRSQWTGRMGGGRYVSFDVAELQVDLAQARQVLKRHHVAREEWFIMATREDCHCGYEILRQRLGALTDEECRAGFESCLRRGWLRQVDERVVADIDELLQADGVFVVERGCGDITFSVEGAELYRTISAEIFGDGWEDGLTAEDSYYREEHRYCATEAAIGAVTTEYSDSGEHPKATRLVPIGPWCVYWWEPFPSGHRLELIFGEL